MDLVFQSWQELTLTENHIAQLHALMLKHSDKDEHHRGRYKKLSNNVAAYGADGREIGIVFETTPPFQTPWEMQRLIDWANRAAAEKWLHPLLIILLCRCVFHLRQRSKVVSAAPSDGAMAPHTGILYNPPLSVARVSP
jgi:hypothetical protein